MCVAQWRNGYIEYRREQVSSSGGRTTPRTLAASEGVALRHEEAWRHAGPRLATRGERANHRSPTKDTLMKYGLAWLLGIPIPILAVVYLVSHC